MKSWKKLPYLFCKKAMLPSCVATSSSSRCTCKVTFTWDTSAFFFSGLHELMITTIIKQAAGSTLLKQRRIFAKKFIEFKIRYSFPMKKTLVVLYTLLTAFSSFGQAE